MTMPKLPENWRDASDDELMQCVELLVMYAPRSSKICAEWFAEFVLELARRGTYLHSLNINGQTTEIFSDKGMNNFWQWYEAQQN